MQDEMTAGAGLARQPGTAQADDGAATAPRGRVFGLDALRAAAILGVLFLHLVHLMKALGHASPFVATVESAAGTAAAFGVDAFFVLSGLLIGRILLSLEPHFHQPRALLAFWQRRWLRTFPNYLLFLGLTIWLYPFVRELFTGSLPFLPRLPFLERFFFFSQNLLWVHPGYFLESWTLTIEEWFYFTFPLAVFAMSRRLPFGIAFVLSAILFTVGPTMLRFLWLSAGHSDWGTEFQRIVVNRLDAPMYGVLAARFSQMLPTVWRRIRRPLLLVGALVLVANGWYMTNIGVTSAYAKTLFFSVTSLGVLFLLPALDHWRVTGSNLLILAVRKTALWSYALYLCNIPVALLLIKWNLSLGPATPMRAYALEFAFIIGCFLVSALIYRYFEKPIMDLRERFAVKLPRAVS